MHANDEIRQSPYAAIARFVAVQLGALLFGLGLQCILSRRMESAEYVHFVTSVSLTSTLSVLVGGATPRAVARLVAIDSTWVASSMNAFWRVHLPVCSVFALLLIANSRALSRFYGDDALAIALCVLAVEFWLRAGIAEPAWQLLNGLGEHRGQARLMGIHSFLRAFITTSLVLFSPTLLSAVIGLLVTAGISTFLGIVAVSHLSRTVTSDDESRRKQLASEVRRWWTYGAFVDASLFSLPATTLWITMAYSPQHSQLGALTTSYVLGQAIVPLLQAVNRGFVRMTVVEKEQDSVSGARRVLADVLQGLLPIVGLILLMAFCGGAWMLQVLFGAKYVAGWWLPGAVVVGMLGLSISYLFSEALGNCGRLRERFVCMLGVSVVSLLMTISLSSAFGPSGGALAIGVTGIATLATLGRALQMRIGDFWPWPGLKAVLLSAALAALGFGMLSSQFDGNDLPVLVITAAVYLGALLVTQEPGSRRMWLYVTSVADRLRPSTQSPAPTPDTSGPLAEQPLSTP